MSKSKIIENVHRFLVKIEGKELDGFPKFQLEAKALRWDLESVFHFSDSQPENSADEESRAALKEADYKIKCINGVMRFY